MKNNRRDFIIKSSAVVAGLSTGIGSNVLAAKPKSVLQKKVQWPILEGPDTPKLILNSRIDATVESMRMTKQLGADYVLMTGPPLPWTESGLRSIINRFKAEGLTVLNLMMGTIAGPGIPNVIFGNPGRDEEIRQVQDSLRAAGAVGIPIVEYNFYAHRLTEGYYRMLGRGGAGYTAYDFNRVSEEWLYPAGRAEKERSLAPKELPPLADRGSRTREQLWANLTYFLKAVIPVAEKAGVRMALHPNDPPAPVSRGSQQIMATFADWKRMVNIVDSPCNGMTFDCGVSNEIGADPLEVLDYLASRDRINHVHYRNCIVDIPSTKYVEVFPDNGTVNMFAVMQQLVKRKYKYGLYAEHPRLLDYDKKNPMEGEFANAGWAYNQAYARAMLQACLNLEQINA